MPSVTFLHLPKEKQEKIIGTCKKEFTSCTLNHASINKIIKDADISRGSFYQYFTDIEDAYFYIIFSYRNDLFNKLFYYIKLNNNDLIEGFLSLFDYICFYKLTKVEEKFFHNIILNMNNYHQKRLNNDKCDFYETNRKKLLEIVDTSKFNDFAKDNIEEVFTLLFHMLMHSIVPVFIKKTDKNISKQHFNKRIRLIEGGIY